MFGDYAGFIVPAYVISALVLASLIVWLWLQHRARLRDLDELERSGARRRSAMKGER